jgi:hypothetical protein
MSTVRPTTWEDLARRRIAVPKHVAFRSFIAETVLLNLDTGQYHGLDTVGGRFFAILRGSSDASSAAETLAAEYEQPLERIQQDMVAFCSSLSELGLIELVDGDD